MTKGVQRAEVGAKLPRYAAPSPEHRINMLEALYMLEESGLFPCGNRASVVIGVSMKLEPHIIEQGEHRDKAKHAYRIPC